MRLRERLTAVTLVLLAPLAQATLIPNGDFETPNLGTTFPLYIPAGSGAVSGWTIGGAGGVTIHHVSANQPYWTGNTTQWMDLTGNTGGAYIEQAVTTSSGTTYLVTFDTFNGSLSWGQGIPVATGFSVSALGISSMNVTVTPGTSALVSFYFTATGPSTTLRFTELTGRDSNAGWIDNVAVSAVPEPTSVIAGALLLLPFAGSTLRFVRRRHAV